MDYEKQAFFRAMIVKQMHEAAEQMKSPIPDEPVFQFRGSDGAESEGPNHSDIVVDVRTRERAKTIMNACLAAISRLDSGTYGICCSVTCQEDIRESRLQVNPTAVFCLDCQLKADKKKASKGLTLPHVGPRAVVSFLLEETKH